MLHHVSINARDPDKAAAALARMVRATALRAPQPPFPQGSWFVCFGDAQGTLIEIMPWGETRDLAAPGGLGFDPDMRATSGSHVLLGTRLSATELFALAELEGWRAELASAGLFQFVKVWVEDRFLVEFLTPELSPAYLEHFGTGGLASLDGKLRAIESALADVQASQNSSGCSGG
jgi:hypothetical protein